MTDETPMFARCGACGEPAAQMICGDAREVERNPMVVVRCRACAMTEAAERITADAAGADHDR